MKEYIVTVMARDRVGIVRDTSTALYDLGGNITHMSQTVMRGYFTLIMSVEMPDDRTQLEIRQGVERMGEVGELEVNVRPYFEAPAGKESQSERFTLSIQGLDQKGIISKVTTYLADSNINIDDFYAYLLDGRSVMLIQVSIPISVNVEEVQAGLRRLGEERSLTVHLQHQNIFRATSEITPVMDLD
ncbi:MAG TPA: ACT domain-containing protein [Armatimonadota bacterium]|jgi:glycine cleavage system transcriptional repressor